jgi:hypothetical protein
VSLPCFRDDLPPRDQRRGFIPIWTARSVFPSIFVLTGQSVLLAKTHWIEGRTRPCAGEHCFCSATGSRPKIKGYVSAVLATKLTEGLLELTEGACQQLADLVPIGAELRGKKIAVRRRTAKACSPVDVQIAHVSLPCDLPASIDPIPYLMRLWGLRADFSFLHQGGLRKLADRPVYQAPEETPS